MKSSSNNLGLDVETALRIFKENQLGMNTFLLFDSIEPKVIEFLHYSEFLILLDLNSTKS